MLPEIMQDQEYSSFPKKEYSNKSRQRQPASGVVKLAASATFLCLWPELSQMLVRSLFI